MDNELALTADSKLVDKAIKKIEINMVGDHIDFVKLAHDIRDSIGESNISIFFSDDKHTCSPAALLHRGHCACQLRRPFISNTMSYIGGMYGAAVAAELQRVARPLASVARAENTKID